MAAISGCFKASAALSLGAAGLDAVAAAEAAGAEAAAAGAADLAFLGAAAAGVITRAERVSIERIFLTILCYSFDGFLTMGGRMVKAA